MTSSYYFCDDNDNENEDEDDNEKRRKTESNITKSADAELESIRKSTRGRVVKHQWTPTKTPTKEEEKPLSRKSSLRPKNNHHSGRSSLKLQNNNDNNEDNNTKVTRSRNKNNGSDDTDTDTDTDNIRVNAGAGALTSMELWDGSIVSCGDYVYTFSGEESMEQLTSKVNTPGNNTKYLNDSQNGEDEGYLCVLCGESSCCHTDNNDDDTDIGNVIIECEECLMGFHCKCLQPPLKKIPEVMRVIGLIE